MLGKFALFFVIGFILSFPAFAYESISEGDFVLYEGDYNSDGLQDLILYPHRFILISNDINVPFFVDTAAKPIVLLKNSDDEYSIIDEEGIASKIKTLFENGNLSSSAYQLLFGDLGSTGYLDIILQPVSDYNDLVIIRNETAGFKSYTFDMVDLGYNLIGSNSVIITISDGKLTTTSELYGQAEFTFDFTNPQTPTVDVIYPQTNTTQTGSIVGQIPHSAWVDVSGAARYQVPIRIPSGINRLQPNLSLSYNSNRGKGSLGVGWSLSGIPSIRRCNANVAEDGYIAGIKLNDNDKYCLNGQKLKLASGSDRIYKTEMESFQKIVSVGGSVGNPGHWEVTDAKGNIWFYGNGSDALLKNRSINLSWSISQIKDVSGNEVNYVYDNIDSSGVVRIKEISYAATSIKFTYSGNSNPSIHYFAGKKTFNNKLLNNINVSSNGTGSNISYDYKLSYQKADGSKLQKINSLGFCDYDKCVMPTGFTYQDQDPADFAKLTVNSGSLGNYFATKRIERHGGDDVTVTHYQSSFLSLDFNGDGFKDIAKVLSNGDAKMVTVYQNQNNGIFTPVASANITGNINEHDFIAFDINGDGYDDIADIQYRNGTDKFSALMSNGVNALDHPAQTFFGSSQNGKGNGVRYRVLDIDSDGLDDLVDLFETGGMAYARACVNSGNGSMGLCTVTQLSNWSTIGDSVNSRFLTFDANGDGLQDIVAIYQLSNTSFIRPFINKGDGTFDNTIEAKNLGGWDLRAGKQPVFKAFDTNGDGLTDIIKVHENGGRTFVEAWLNTGDNGFIQEKANMAISDSWGGSYYAIDVNLDGIKDLMRVSQENNASYSMSWISDQSGGFYAGSGRALGPLKVSKEFGNGQDRYTLTENVAKQFLVMDSNGDGSSDLVEIYQSQYGYGSQATPLTWKPSAISYLDKLTEVDNGLTVSNKFAYGLSSNSKFYQSSERPKGIVRTSNSPRTLVTEVHTDNGIGGFNQEYYRYYDLKTHYQGLGRLGFGKIEKFDLGQNLAEVSQFNQDWEARRYASVKTKEICSLSSSFNVSSYSGSNYCQANATNLLERESHQWVSKVFGSGGGLIASCKSDDCGISNDKVNSASFHVYKAQSLYESWGDGKDANGKRLIKRSYDTNGNLTNQTSEYGTGSSGNADTGFTLSGIHATEQTDYTYDSDLIGDHIFKPSSITHRVSGLKGEGDKANINNTTIFQYDGDGLLTTKISEPGKDEQITETYSSFDRGLPKTITRSWLSANTANTSLVGNSTTEDYTYDGNGAVSSKVDALVHTQSFTAHPLYDVQSSYTDINGQTTTTEVDVLGRVTKVAAPQYTTNYEYKDCNGCANNARYYVYQTTTAQPSKKLYYDTLNRNVASNKQILSGDWSQVLTSYNAKGQVVKVTEPSLSSTSMGTSYSYYNDGRLKVENKPASDHSITYSYNGLLHTKAETFSGGTQTSYNSMNAFGLLDYGLDAMGNKTQYFYNGRKQLVKTIDVDLNEITIEYDVYGNRTKLVDPDKGTWTFTNNALGLVASENNGNGQVTSFNYDLLGRMTSRTNSEGTSTWDYVKTGYGVGQLHQAKQNGYKETYAYDGFGNLAQKAVEFGDGQTAEMNWHYVQGKLNTQTFPGGYAIKQVYNSTGYLSEIQNTTDSGDKHWQAISMDARGNLTGYKLDGTLTTTRSYDAATGFVKTIKSGWNSDSDAQLSSYTFDSLGNLKTRDNKLFMDSLTTQANQRTGQSFTYDALNRLNTWNTRQFGDNQDAIQTLSMSYAANGNILSKPSVGDYTYGANQGTNNCTVTPGPHAVSYIDGKGNYCYDASGNLLSGDGKTLTYTSFDKPKTINKSGSTTEILYGPSLGRYKRVDTIAGETQTTWYLDGLYEKVLDKNSKTTERFYLGDFGLMERTTADNGTVMDQTRYFLKDHIGSVLAIAEGNSMRLLQEFHYDVWGKREYTKVYADPSLPAWDSFGLTGRQGFTGHEMLDNVGLIHMNGRVYDPELGRFVSADPKIPDPYNSQAFNRYAYVYNNPLSFTDPDGFSPKESPEQEEDVNWRNDWDDKDSDDDGSSGSSDGSVESNQNDLNYTFVSVDETYIERVFVDGVNVTKVDKYMEPKWVGLTGVGSLIDIFLRKGLNLDIQLKVQPIHVYELYEEVSVTTDYRVSYNSGSLGSTVSEVLKEHEPVQTKKEKEWIASPIKVSDKIIDFKVCGFSCGMIDSIKTGEVK